MKKRMAIFLVITLLVLASCSEQTVPSETGGAPEVVSAEPAAPAETDPPVDTEDHVPAMTFGKEMNFLLPDVSWLTRNIFADEVNGERVNDAQVNLKLAMEERFGTKLSETYTGDIWSTSYITRLVKSDDSSFDICCALDLYAPGYIIEGAVTPYSELEHVDLTRVYWDQSILKCMTVGGTPYFAFGAYDLSYYDFTHALVFSKDMVADYGLEDPYALVRADRWTVDKFYEMARTVVDDLDGDGAMTWRDDRFGYMSEPKQVLPNFWISAGELTIEKDADDYPYLNINGNDRFYTIFDKIYSVMWDGGVWCSDQAGIDYWADTGRMFAGGRALFVDEIFFRLNELRDVEVRFGILPYPLFDDTQTEYYSRVEAGARIAMVPITNRNPEYAGALLEAMSSYGYNNLIPEYYEVALKRKASRDEESAAMLDFIFATRRYDLGDTWWCNQIRDGTFKNMFAENDRNLSSKIAGQEKIVNKTIEKVIAKVKG